MEYIDGFMSAVPQQNKESYLKFAAIAADVFKDYGALSVVECWGNEVPEGKVNSMHTAVMREEGEAVVFAWVRWPSKSVRDEAWPKIMQDDRMPKDMSAAPFDGKRMIFGGFDVILDV